MEKKDRMLELECDDTSQGPVDGTVVMYAKPQKGDDVALWRISHDGDEDLEEQELRLAIDVMKKWKSSGHPYIGRKG